ncbi:MAG: ArsR family transcriptional regulator [Proteobacteria bacterium]|nr:ArsR family transcriptional regulator [Pseudomonadota bacterium]NDC24247.1 ArsR family transcriptional regulator [Pseudomonadota bacterium]NDD04161.1 ArsR family transcriptional regulator [Pseudomonadota bacterium]NDG26470.1 ArsR family transcriptional regulator [Pseudomonadota bacterium]
MQPSEIYTKVAHQLTRRDHSPEVFNLLADTFKALGDPTRVQIVWSLTHGELCVTDIANLLDLTASAVSHHLRTLRNLRLVKVRRNHRSLFYSLDDDHIENLLEEGMEHVEDLIS